MSLVILRIKKVADDSVCFWNWREERMYPLQMAAWFNSEKEKEKYVQKKY